MDEFYEGREEQVKEPQKSADERQSESSSRTLQPGGQEECFPQQI
jgi:hypothetical protein